MAIDMKTLNSIQSYQSSMKLDISQERTATLKTASDLPNTPSGVKQALEEKSFQTAKFEQNASVITHLFNQGSQQDVEIFSMKINYQSAIEAINEKLRADLGLDADATDPVSQQKLNDQGGMEYWTPENTAKRIVEGATAFLGGFQAANPDLQGEALMNKFMDVVGGGLTQGFEQAKGFLGDLKVFEGKVEENYTATYDLVQTGMEQFRKDFLGITDELTEQTTAQPDQPSDSSMAEDNKLNE